MPSDPPPVLSLVETEAKPGEYLRLYFLHPESTKAHRKVIMQMTFITPDQLMEFLVTLMEHAADVWPNHPAAQMWTEEED